MPEDDLKSLPPFLQTRVRSLAAMACRTGDRQELTKGTLTYAGMFVYTYAGVFIHICAYTYMYTCVYVYRYICTCIYGLYHS